MYAFYLNESNVYRFRGLPCLPDPIHTCHVIQNGAQAHVFNNFYMGDKPGSRFLYELKDTTHSDEWEACNIPSLPYKHCFGTMINGQVIVAGGFWPVSERVPDVFLLDQESQIWCSLPPLAQAVASPHFLHCKEGIVCVDPFYGNIKIQHLPLY